MELIEFEDVDFFVPECIPQVSVRTQVGIASVVTTEPQADEAWRVLQDYVVNKIVEIHGPFPRDGLKESGVFKGFVNRWGFTQAMAIARCAFETYGGMWYNAPVRVQRFTKGSDPYFAVQIAALLGFDR